MQPIMYVGVSLKPSYRFISVVASSITNTRLPMLTGPKYLPSLFLYFLLIFLIYLSINFCVDIGWTVLPGIILLLYPPIIIISFF